MARIGCYDHIGVTTRLDLDDLVQKLDAGNYGIHQLLSALVRHRKNKYKGIEYQDVCNIAVDIEEALNRGKF